MKSHNKNSVDGVISLKGACLFITLVDFDLKGACPDGLVV